MSEATRTERRERPAQPTPSCEKWAAVQLYCHGVLPLHRVAALFAHNPAWKSA